KDSTSSSTTSSSTTDTNTNSAKDHQDAENNSNDVDQMGAEGMDNGNINSNYRLANGSGLLNPMSGSVTITPNPVGRTLTITFTNYIGLDGHLRNGTIMYDYSASLSSATHYRDSGIVISVTTPNNDYYVDSNKIQINKTITNKGRYTNGNLTWHITTTLTITKANNGGTIQYTATRDNVLLNTNTIMYNGASVQASFAGYNTAIDWSTAVIGITGNASGTSADGLSYTANISTMLVRNFNCSPSLIHHHFHPFVAGQIDFTPAGKTTRSINFGTGACDETYTITIGSWYVTITYVW
ncbi:MAG TPA: hypothetical protein VKG26_15005, partial [Bacteroidia bacterium]|nr:hypothetical protein [Bacteroidia bacterium]